MANPFSGEWLLDYSKEHLMHEISMLWETSEELPKCEEGSTEYVALLESFALHLRTIIEFLIFSPSDEYVRAHHFFEDSASWAPVKPPELTKLHSRASNEVAHLTTKRVSGAAEEKKWHTANILQQIEPLLSEFAAKASTTKLHATVREFFRVPSTERFVWIRDNIAHSNIAVPNPITVTAVSTFAASTATVLRAGSTLLPIDDSGK